MLVFVDVIDLSFKIGIIVMNECKSYEPVNAHVALFSIIAFKGHFEIPSAIVKLLKNASRAFALDLAHI